MRTMWKLFTGDVRRMTSNVVSIIIMIGLVVIPPLFTWFNVTASWDPFGNTRNLKFAVANTDKGYKSDLVPIKISVGDQVVSQLHENSQLDWTFTSKDEAIEGTKSGEYYAAVIIPSDFSKTMMTLFSPGAKHATLGYYTNEKKNAVASKVTGQGADSIAKQVNQMFSQTITTAALAVASGLIDEMNEPQAKQRMSSFSTNITDFSTQLTQAAANVHAYGSLTTATTGLLEDSNQLLHTANSDAKHASKQLSGTGLNVKDATSALDLATAATTNALSASTSSYTAVRNNVDQAFASTGKMAGDLSESLRKQAGLVGKQVGQYQQVRTALAALHTDDPAGLHAVLAALDAVIDQQNDLQHSLERTANSLASTNADAQKQHDEIITLTKQAQNNITELNTNLSDTLKPQIKKISGTLSQVNTILGQSAGTLDDNLDTLDSTTGKAAGKLTSTQQQLNEISQSLITASDRLSDFNTKLVQALNSDDMSQVKKLLSGDTEQLSGTLAAPVELERNAVYPVENFGTSLTPFYTFIPLWVGSLLMALTLQTTVSRKTKRQLAQERTGWHWAHVRAKQARRDRDNDLDKTASLTVDQAGTLFDEPKSYQLFLGRFGIFALISLMQSTASSAGTLLFLRVHAVHPLLFMFSAWVSGLVYAFIIYTLVACFGTIGKAVSVIILVMQVSGSSGSYPLQVLPKFVSAVNPFLPATHSIQAARAAIAGIYDGDYFKELGILLIFASVALVIGLVTPKPTKLNTWFNKGAERTKLI